MGKISRVKKTGKPKTIIGWNEEVDLPDFDIWDLPTKIDTGAKTSSLHVEDIEKLPQNKIRFKVIYDDRKPERNKTITTKILRRAAVRTSSMHSHYRIFVKTKLSLGPVTRDIEINLTDRSDLKFRMILGRSALHKNVLINASKSHLLSKMKTKELK